MYAPDPIETVTPDEAARFNALSARLAALKAEQDTHHDERARALHRQAHAGVRATFTVVDPLPLPPELQVGPFTPGARFPAYVRFSNGNWARAKKDAPDIRGFALKLVGVPGTKVLTGTDSPVTQDFLLNQTATAAVRTPEEFIALATSFAKGQLGGPFRLIGEVGFGRAIAIIKSTLAGMNAPFPSFGLGAFWSMVPFRFGPTAARFSLVPRATHAATPGGLTADLASCLKTGLAWDFRVQLYQDATRTPIEDPSVDWDAPWHVVATVEIPPTDLAEPGAAAVSAYVERLAFDPWHAVEALRPLGALNRLRKVAYYEASAKGRECAPEPDGTEVD